MVVGLDEIISVAGFLVIVGNSVRAVFIGLGEFVPSVLIVSVRGFLVIVGNGVGIVVIVLGEFVPSFLLVSGFLVIVGNCVSVVFAGVGGVIGGSGFSVGIFSVVSSRNEQLRNVKHLDTN